MKEFKDKVAVITGCTFPKNLCSGYKLEQGTIEDA
jgi:hypothetical protein